MPVHLTASSSVLDDEDLTRWFLTRGANPNATAGVLDITPLSVAVEIAPLSMIELLFQYGGTTERGQLLHHAAMREGPDHVEVLDFLFARGVTDVSGLLYGNHPDSFQLMSNVGLGTPLHVAAEKGMLGTVQYLLDKGADIQMRDTRGRLAIDCAGSNRHSAVVEVLRRASHLDQQ